MFEYKIIRLCDPYSFKGYIFFIFILIYPECELYKVQPFEINQFFHHQKQVTVSRQGSKHNTYVIL